MKPDLKMMTAWVRPKAEEDLPEVKESLEGLLVGFYGAFPEYQDCLRFFQSPRVPHHVFVYVNGGCTGLLPGASRYLEQMLQRAFLGSEVRLYGKAWVC